MLRFRVGMRRNGRRLAPQWTIGRSSFSEGNQTNRWPAPPGPTGPPAVIRVFRTYAFLLIFRFDGDSRDPRWRSRESPFGAFSSVSSRSRRQRDERRRSDFISVKESARLSEPNALVRQRIASFLVARGGKNRRAKRRDGHSCVRRSPVSNLYFSRGECERPGRRYDVG